MVPLRPLQRRRRSWPWPSGRRPGSRRPVRFFYFWLARALPGLLYPTHTPVCHLSLTLSVYHLTGKAPATNDPALVNRDDPVSTLRISQPIWTGGKLGANVTRANELKQSKEASVL